MRLLILMKSGSCLQDFPGLTYHPKLECTHSLQNFGIQSCNLQIVGWLQYLEHQSFENKC